MSRIKASIGFGRDKKFIELDKNGRSVFNSGSLVKPRPTRSRGAQQKEKYEKIF